MGSYFRGFWIKRTRSRGFSHRYSSCLILSCSYFHFHTIISSFSSNLPPLFALPPHQGCSSGLTNIPGLGRLQYNPIDQNLRLPPPVLWLDLKGSLCLMDSQSNLSINRHATGRIVSSLLRPHKWPTNEKEQELESRWLMNNAPYASNSH